MRWRAAVKACATVPVRSTSTSVPANKKPSVVAVPIQVSVGSAEIASISMARTRPVTYAARRAFEMALGFSGWVEPKRVSKTRRSSMSSGMMRVPGHRLSDLAIDRIADLLYRLVSNGISARFGRCPDGADLARDVLERANGVRNPVNAVAVDYLYRCTEIAGDDQLRPGAPGFAFQRVDQSSSVRCARPAGRETSLPRET